MHTPFSVRQDDPGRGEIAILIRAHLAEMAQHSPPQSIHALSIEELRAPNVTFWSVWAGSALAGCGALKELDATHGEIKSMRTAAGYLRQGVASSLLEHLMAEARRRGYLRLSLETGSMAAYAAARRLYTQFGFETCPPFASYALDPNSIFMTRAL